MARQATLVSLKTLPLRSAVDHSFWKFTRPPETYAAILHGLNPSASVPQAQKTHAHLFKSGFSNHLCIVTKLLNLYAKKLRFSDAKLVFDSIPEPDAFSFATLISAHSRADRFEEVLSFFHLMVSQGLQPDNFVFPSALRACAGLSVLQIGRQIHNLASVSGFAIDSFVQSSLVHMYVKCGELSDAHKVFDKMPQRNVVCWSAMVAGYARQGLVGESLELFDQMRSSGVEPNSVSWNGVIAGLTHNGYFCDSVNLFVKMHSEGFKPDGTTVSSVLPAVGDLQDLATGFQIHGYAIKHGFESDICVTSALVDMYGKCGHTEKMQQVFDEMLEMDLGSCNALVAGFSRNGLVDEALRVFRQFKSQGLKLNVISWTSMVACCAQNGKDIEALELFREMQLVGVKPNSVTIPCLLPACANIAALQHGREIHCFSLRRGIFTDVYVGSALIDMYAKCGRISDARRVFDKMLLRNLVSWNAIVGGYAMHGKAKDAIELFSLMQRSGQGPDFISFTCVLSACSQAGLTEEGWYYFNSMSREHGIAARMEHHACMVSLLGRAGKLAEAYSLIMEMSPEPDACVWGALLSSCRVHSNVDLGEIAAEKLFKLEPENAGNYVLLSNIYATAGMWDGVDRVRDMMKSLGLRKNPGCSWIEIKNRMYTLLAGDKTHPQMTQIIEKLDSLSMEMKKSGYLPKTNFVLQDVEEQDKEQILCGHSEKLAIGFGLLNTRPRSPLRVIKNLRTCGDCHAAIKFISRFESREIFVRDTNRFHHFKDGICSCGDYW